jgi:hypothetical protein
MEQNAVPSTRYIYRRRFLSHYCRKKRKSATLHSSPSVSPLNAPFLPPFRLATLRHETGMLHEIYWPIYKPLIIHTLFILPRLYIWTGLKAKADL